MIITFSVIETRSANDGGVNAGNQIDYVLIKSIKRRKRISLRPPV